MNFNICCIQYLSLETSPYSTAKSTLRLCTIWQTGRSKRLQIKTMQQLNHHHHHEESVSTYGSFTDRSQRQSDGYSQGLPSSSVTISTSINKYGATRPQYGLLVFGVSLLVLSMIAVVATFHPSIAASNSLSIITMDSSALSTTASNPLIDILQSSSTIIHPQSYYKGKVDEYPSLSIDLEHERQVYNGRTTREQTSMTIEWTNGHFHSSSSDILNKNTNDKNIVALLCGDSDSHLYYMDAKTLSDATSGSDHSHRKLLLRHRIRRRSLTETEWGYYGGKDFDWWGGSGTIREKTWHSSNNDDTTYENFHDGNNVWYIPSVPQYILDQRKCQAIIYYYLRDDEYVGICKSTIIHI
jgi:hypothetical protein